MEIVSPLTTLAMPSTSVCAERIRSELQKKIWAPGTAENVCGTFQYPVALSNLAGLPRLLIG